MFKNILIPLDGSPVGEVALQYAEALAVRTGARLTLVRAAHVQRPLGDAGDQQRAVADAEDYLTAQAQKLAKHGFEVETGVPFGGSAASWIAEEIDLRHADMVVMATHDRVGPDRWVHGSVAEVVVGHVSVPVMLVRPTHGAQLVERFTGERPVLVVPLDGSELAEAALPLASELAARFAGQVVLVCVVPGPGHIVAVKGGVTVLTYVGGFGRLRANARDYLDGMVGRLSAAGVSAAASVRTGSSAHQIAAAASDHTAAVVVMATHGRSGVARSILGSVAGETLHHSPCPVMLIRPATLRPTVVEVPSQALAMPAGVG